MNGLAIIICEINLLILFYFELNRPVSFCYSIFRFRYYQRRKIEFLDLKISIK